MWIEFQIPPQLCTDEVLARIPSPTGQWTAVLKEQVCEAGAMAITTIVADVLLISAQHPEQPVSVLGVDTGGHEVERPRVAWTAPDVLQVTVLNISYSTIETRHVGDIAIDVRFDPDDPGARAAWREKNGLTPDPAN